MRWKTGMRAALNRQSGFVGEAEQLGVMDLTATRKKRE
jgi:hypothetical protein